MSLHFDITGDNSNFLRKLDEANNGIRSTSKQIEESGTSIEQMFGRMAKGAAALGAGFSAQQFASQVLKVRGEFQQLEVAFNTMLGSEEKATALMQQLVKTAATTPFDLQSVAGGAKQLLAYGTAADDVNGTLVRLGDIAAGLSIPLGDLVYLYGTTMSQGRLYTQDLNQFTGRGIPMIGELAKQFGVAESEVKKLVESGKVGFPEVQKVIESLTNEGGKFGGLMEAQSKTITGQISNIEDSISTMYNNIGKQSEGMINDALSGVSYLVANYEQIGKTIMELAVTYGSYKAVLMSVAAYQSVAIGITYSVEIAELSKLIPLKQQSANQDLVAAVASGKLTQSKADQVIALRAEIAAKIQSMQATKAQAQAEFSSALATYKASRLRYTVAQEQVALAQSQMSIAIKSGTVEEIATAKKNSQTASLELNNAAVAKNTAHKGVNIAATNSKSASEALNTVQTGLNTVSQNTNTISTNILTAAKTKLAAASKALGLSMLANPYVLAAAAVAGLAYGIYKLATAETVAEKAARQHREEQEKFQKTIDERKQRIEELIRIIQDETETEYAKAKAYDELQRLSPALTSAYTREQLAVASLTDTNKKLNEERDKNNYDNIISNVNKYTETLSKARKEAERLREDAKNEKDPEKAANLSNLAFGQDMATANAERNLSQWQKDLDEYNRVKKEAEESAKPIKVKLLEAKNSRDQIIQEYAAAKLTLEEEQKKIQESGFGVIPIDVQIRFDNSQKQLLNINSIINNLQSGKVAQGVSSIQNKSYWEGEKKNAQEKLDALTDIEAAGAKGLVLKKKIAGYDKKINSFSTNTSKQESAAEKLRKEQEKLKELKAQNAKDLAHKLEDLYFGADQARINAMDEGSKKALAQMELSHEKELFAIDREKNDFIQAKINAAKAEFDAEENINATKNPNHEKQTFDSSGIGLSDSENTSYDNKYKAALDKQAKDRQAYYDAEKQSMNEYLASYGGYMQKRNAIIAQGEERKKGKNDWEKKSIDEETKKLLAGVDDEVQKKTSIITQLFSDMSKRTVADMRLIADQAQQTLDYVNAGEFETDDSGKGLFGLTKEQFDILSKSPEKLESIKNEIANVRKEADASETAFNKLGNGLKKVFSSGGDTKKFQEGLAELSEGMNSVMQAGQFLSDSLSELGDAFGNDTLSGIAEGINLAMDAMGSAMDGAKAGAAFGPWGAAAGAAIGMVTSLASSFAKIHDAKNEKRIQRLQDQIEVLEKSYDKLGNSIEKAYSKDASKLIAQQNTLLEQQKVLIRNQIAEEKGKKKSDGGRIEEWEQQIEDINKLIADNKEKAIDAIFGEDLKSAIDNFASAYADAWTSGEDKAKSAKDTVKDMMRQMVTESIKAAIQSSQSMEKIRAKLQEFYADSVLSGWEQDYIYQMSEDLQEELDRKFGWADGLMKDEEKSTSQDSTKGMSQSMDQDTGNELNGRFTAFQISNEGIKNSNEEIKNSMLSMLIGVNLISATTTANGITLMEIRNLVISSNSYLEDIARFTKPLLEVGGKLDRIDSNTKGLTSR